MRIAHLADIHWRGLTRHEEYRRAFTRAFAKLKELAPDIIVICGDIFETKTQGISPELIDQLVWWFTNLAEIAETHVILGNHDGNLMNPNRQDAISPIIKALDDDRIVLHKKSRVYQVRQWVTREGVPDKPGRLSVSSQEPVANLCVYSLFDRENWDVVLPEAKRLPADFSIALFHGTVNGSVTDMDYTMEEGEVPVSFFEGYDFALLGDVHKRQNLAFRNGKPWIAYPGSSIQQNYGEEQEKGFLLWDIRSRTDFDVDFHPIPHDSPFVTVPWGGTVKETLAKLKLSKGTRVRISSDGKLIQTDAKALEDKLRSLGASEVVYQDDPVAPSDQEQVVVAGDDLRKPAKVKALLREYMGEDALESDLAAVDQLVDSYLSGLDADEDVKRGTRWSIRRLEFSNLFGYGEGNWIDFDTLGGITGVFGPNRIGKSSIIGVLMYALFNSTDRGPIQNINIINSRKDHCFASVTLTVDGVDYRVERQTVKKVTKTATTAITNLNLVRIDPNGEVELNGEQRKDTEKEIRRLIGSPEDLLLTSISAQGDTNKFIETGSAQRDRIVSRFLDLVVFEKLYDLAKEDSAGLRAQLKDLPDRPWDKLLSDISARLVEIAHREGDIMSETATRQQVLDSLRVQLATKGKRDVVTKWDVTEQEKKVQGIEKKIRDQMMKLEEQVQQMQDESLKLSQIQDDLSKISVDDLRAKQAKYYELRDALKEIRHAHEKESTILENQEASALKILDVPCGDQFPTCKYIRDSHIDRDRIPVQQERVGILGKKLSKAEQIFSKFDVNDVEAALKRHSQLVQRESDAKVRISRTKESITRWEEDLGRQRSDLVESKVRLDDLLARVTSTDDGLDLLKSSISETEGQIRQLNREALDLASERGKLSSDQERYVSERDRCVDIRSRWRIFEVFMDACSKKGIPSRIVRAALPAINSEIAKRLAGVVEFTLELAKDGDSTEIYIDYGDSKRILELGSGMEKVVSSLALRAALVNSSSLPRPDFLVIDEGFGTMDENGVAACNRFILSLKRWFKHVIVITHVDGVKDTADGVIEVTRKGRDSRVEVG